MAVSFATIFMAKIEKGILKQGTKQPLVWKRFIDDIFCLWDTLTKNIFNFSLRKEILITSLLSSLLLKSWKLKQHSWTQRSLRDSNSRKKAFLTCVHFSNQLKPFRTLTSTAVTHQAIKKALSKEKLSDFLEQTLQEILLQTTLKSSKCTLFLGFILRN